MSVQTTTHLNFRGEAREALAFYASVFGGEPVVLTYGDAGAPPTPEEAGLVMWGQVATPAGFRVMAFDVPAARPYDQGTAAFFVSLRVDDADELTGYWEALAAVSTVLVPLAPAAWSELYGMLTDPYGVTWVLDLAPELA